ncbi:MAG: phenylalanine--tRNA ligase subunit beta [bacterium]|nr:phenylalanine--tRNA ligase subunit beta [bacterium]
MKLSYNWLKEYVTTLPKPEKLAELLTFHVAEVEKVERMGGDFVLSMDILPNRAHDLNSHIGIAREIAAFTGKKLRLPDARFKEGKIKNADALSVRIEDVEGCPRYIGRYVEGIKVGPSPKWMQEKLLATGMRPVNNVVDATNFVMLEYGQPLHAFDASQIGSNKKQTEKKGIVVRKAKKGEKFTTLDDQIFVLDGSELLIADNEKALALAGIKGGKKAGITSKTKNLILEAANFDSVLIRRTSEKLGIRTDSSRQFTGGLHPVLAERAMERLSSLIQQLAGGVMYDGAVDAYPKKWPVVRVLFDSTACNAILGTSLKDSEMKKMLIMLGCRLSVVGRKLLVVVPAERLDLATSEDLYEEIGRLYGWDKIQAKSAEAHLAPGSQDPMYALSELSRKILCSMGYSEHIGYTLIGEQVSALFRKSGLRLLELQNPMSEDARYLRPTLMPSLLEAVAANAKKRDAVRIFEIGKHFMEVGGTMKEHMGLGIMFYLKKEITLHEAWYELKGVLDMFFASHGLGDMVFAEMSSERKEAMRLLLEPEGLAELHINGAPIGSIGMVTKQPKDVYGIEGMVVRAHVDLASLEFASVQEREFADIPKYPAITRDIAVLVPKGVRVEEVQNVIEREGEDLLFDVDLFDIYEGEGVGDDKESLAFHLIFQSAERTLKDLEVNEIMKRIVEGLKKEDWEIRE